MLHFVFKSTHAPLLGTWWAKHDRCHGWSQLFLPN